jgi:uncharacterized protein YnzC (UPF0291/DUF896 family)
LKNESTELSMNKNRIEYELKILRSRYEICDKVAKVNQAKKPDLSERLTKRANDFNEQLKLKKTEVEEFEVTFYQRMEEIKAIIDFI